MDRFKELASLLRSIHSNVMDGDLEVCSECGHVSPCTTLQAIVEIENEA